MQTPGSIPASEENYVLEKKSNNGPPIWSLSFGIKFVRASPQLFDQLRIINNADFAVTKLTIQGSDIYDKEIDLIPAFIRNNKTITSLTLKLTVTSQQEETILAAIKENKNITEFHSSLQIDDSVKIDGPVKKKTRAALVLLTLLSGLLIPLLSETYADNDFARENAEYLMIASAALILVGNIARAYCQQRHPKHSKTIMSAHCLIMTGAVALFASSVWTLFAAGAIDSSGFTAEHKPDKMFTAMYSVVGVLSFVYAAVETGVTWNRYKKTHQT